jgi:CubicO group peptidase (beta-lactamase class C family)
VTGTLLGIAADRGLVTTSQPVLSLLSGYEDLAGQARNRITVAHLLTMTSGIEWDETTYPYTDARNSETAMDLSPSSVRFVLTRDVVDDPGTRFQYCGGCTMLLAAVIREATGQQLDEFAADVLFRPLGIDDFEWLHHPDGLPIAASGLRLRPRDLAKIGFLFVNGGRWRGQQILSPTWIAESTRARIQLDSISAYGYQWWVDIESLAGDPTPFPVARGNGGQRIYVVPRLRLVAVITAGNYNSSASRFSEQAFWRYILPAAIANGRME